MAAVPVPITLLCLAVLFHANPAAATSSDTTENSSWTTSILFENDLFGRSDEQYTNGIKVAWISPDLTQYTESERLPSWSRPIIRRLPFINESGLQRNVTFALGQKIFTPQDIQEAALIENDRPYAGWLYFTAGFHNKNLRRLDTLEIQIGVVGPLSLARQAQNFVHQVRNIPTAKGWDNQLRNEPGIAFIYERKWRNLQSRNPSGFGYDLISHVGGALGNIFVYGNAGVEARIGWNLPADFGLALIRPGGDTSAPIDSSDPRLASSARFGVHAFAAVTGRIVGRDIFLDGNTFRSSHHVDKEHLVADLIAGVSVIFRGLKFSYAQVFRTREFEGQGRFHNFGSVSLSWTF